MFENVSILNMVKNVVNCPTSVFGVMKSMYDDIIQIKVSLQERKKGQFRIEPEDINRYRKIHGGSGTINLVKNKIIKFTCIEIMKIFKFLSQEGIDASDVNNLSESLIINFNNRVDGSRGITKGCNMRENGLRIVYNTIRRDPSAIYIGQIRYLPVARHHILAREKSIGII